MQIVRKIAGLRHRPLVAGAPCPFLFAFFFCAILAVSGRPSAAQAPADAPRSAATELLQAGKFDAAREAFEAVLDADPANVDAREGEVAASEHLALQARAKGRPSVQVFMLIWPEPITTIGKQSFITEIIAAAGGRSITDGLEHEWPHISLESLVALDPESILLVRGSKMSFEDLAKRPEWNRIAAIREHRVFYTDDRLYSPSPVVIDALENLARQFHPGGGAVPSPKQ